MKVTQEKLPASQIGLEIEITPEITQKTYEQVIKNLSRTVNIPGFRKGKVPRQVLLQRLGKTHIKAAALEELLQDGIEQAIKQESIAAIGQPRLRSSFDDLINSYEPGQPLTFTAAVDVEPEINLVQYTGLEAKAEEIKYDPARVDEVLEKERQELATLIPVEGRAAQIGDVAVVDFKGVIAKAEGDDENAEPEPIPGGDASDFQVELQEDKFIPGFVTGIVGMNPGDTKEVSAQFPDPYVNQELAGKPAIFTVTLKEIKEKELPELNDDFAQEVSDFDTLEALRASLAERYQKEAEDKTKNNQQEALLGELVKHIEVDLPETLIEKEVDAMLTQTAMRLSQQGLDVKKLFTQDIIPQLRERSRPEAVERLKRSLGLQEVAKRESIAVTPEEIQARVTELVQQYPDEDIDVERLHTIVENELLSEKIIDWLLANSTIELVPEGSLASQESEITAPETEAETIEVTAESTTGE
ncbi:Trigger factor [Trichormus variabilis ATCC 29413]|uniref:Trigger factor n=2 Tax=Anabaena variabilis TaxID=264691 RepID=TIG_TRIV2|nr:MULTISPECIES: trigger factor [Nostocaceae]Q3M725.1 RecName: Full=Trigger factor; Short=TF; AltName: Full=PPIase [Trichormus variabilis ATCC 29413]ABA23211.1 Trigger factor [Trichormus variabilis ATCC 29413]MBC1212806.1 trigger factor [Trichormus variabilis ARAD]MBC1255517.1 trigger factor [Trichormus variabilis V5]MBC1270587.1 trigger factor [Trichormus variabilis FSR]MBC1301458.1 trigger factor [Trichormus variabilis N2B]